MLKIDHLELNDQIYFTVVPKLRQYGCQELRYWSNYLTEILNNEEKLNEELKYKNSICCNIYKTIKECGII